MKSHWPVSALSALTSAVNMLIPLVLVRVLGPEDVGIFKIFFLYLAIFPAFSCLTGLINGLSYFAGQKDGASAVRMTSLLTLLSGFALALPTALLHRPLARFLGWPETHALLFSFALFGTMAATCYEEAAVATGRLWSGALFGAAVDFARTAAILAAAVATRSLVWIFAVHSGIAALKTALGFWIGRRQGLVSLDWDSRAFRSVWRYAFPVSVAWAFGVLVSYSDQMILSKLVSPAEFAFYSIGCLSVPPLLILETSITRVLIPQMSEAFARGEGGRAARLYRKAVEELVFLSLPAVTGLVVFAGPIIELLFTARYASAAGYLRLYGVFYLLQAVPNDSVPRARGEGRWIRDNFVAFSLLTAAACGSLAWRFGAYGALCGLLLSRALMKAYSVHYVRKTTGWAMRRFLPVAETVRAAGICAVLGVGCLAVRPLFASGLGWFVGAGAAFTLLYFAASFALAVKDDERVSNRRVLLLTPCVEIGGLERMILNLSISLKDAFGWEPEVFAFDHPANSKPEANLLAQFAEHGIPVEAHVKGPGFSLRTVWRIARRLGESEIGVIHSHDLGALIYGVAAKIATFNRVRLVHTQHSFVHLARRKRYRFYERLFALFVDELAVVSEDTRKTYLDLGIPARGISLVPNGVRFSQGAAPERERKRKLSGRRALVEGLSTDGPFGSAAAVLKAHPEDSWLLYLARVHGRKGQDGAIRLWNALDPRLRARCVLVFVGPETEPGRMEELRGLIATAQAPGRIAVVGPSQVPHRWLQAADVFVSCSEFEGMPLGPIEAAGAGLPLVLSDIPGHAMLSDFGRTFPLSRLDEGAQAVADALEAASSRHGERSRLAQAIRARYSLDAMAERYVDLYRRSFAYRRAKPGRLTVEGTA